MRFVALMALLLVSCSPAETPDPEAAPDTPAPSPRQETARMAWVAVEDADLLVLVDLDQGAVVEEHPAPGGPHNLVVADDGTVAAALYSSTELLLLRDGEARSVELGDSPHDVKATTELFVVANEIGNRLDLVDRDGTHLTSVPLTGQPHDVAIAPGGTTTGDARERQRATVQRPAASGTVAWVTMNRTDRLAVVDLEGAEVIEYVPTGRSPHNILFAPDGETFWVTDWQGPVHAFTADGELLESFPVGEEAHHLAFTPDSAEVWVTDHHTRKIYIFDVQALELTGEVDVPGMPHHLNITRDGELAAVADHTNGTLVVYDVGTRDRLRTVEVGPGPHGVWVVP